MLSLVLLVPLLALPTTTTTNKVYDSVIDFCKAIRSGDFAASNLPLHSVSTFKMGPNDNQKELDLVLLYKDQMITLNMRHVTDDRVDIMKAIAVKYSEHTAFKAIADRIPKPPQGVYIFNIKDPKLAWNKGTFATVVNVITTDHVYLYDIEPRRIPSPYEAWIRRRSDLADYTIVHNNERASSVAYGFSMDNLHGTNEIMMYQMNISRYNPHLVNLYPAQPRPSETLPKPFFLHKTHSSAEVRLVALAENSQPDPDRKPLVRSLPLGLLHHWNGDLYLFDREKGCVHRIVGWSKRDLNVHPGGATFRRINYGFESFFHCTVPLAGDFFDRNPRDRCESTIGEDVGPVRPFPVGTRTSSTTMRPAKWSAKHWILATGGGLAVVILAGAGAFFLVTKRRSRKRRRTHHRKPEESRPESRWSSFVSYFSSWRRSRGDRGRGLTRPYRTNYSDVLEQDRKRQKKYRPPSRAPPHRVPPRRKSPSSRMDSSLSGSSNSSSSNG